MLLAIRFSTHAAGCQCRIYGIRCNVLVRQGGPANTTIVETEMENNTSAQENSKINADSI